MVVRKNTILMLVVVALALSFAGSVITYAATTPSLGAAATYGVLSSTYTNTTVSTINGDVGFITPPAVSPGGTHANYGSASPYATAGVDQGAALTNLNAQPCDFNVGAAVDLSSLVQPLTPGVYCSSGAMSITTQLTLSGNGTFIFRSGGALNTAANAEVALTDGASACDLFWTPAEATTLGVNTIFAGTDIGNAGITVGANTVWTGRALAFGGTVTTDTTTITVPACSPAPATLHVVKEVINDNGGTSVASDFTIHVQSGETDVAGSPASGVGSPGAAYSLGAGTYNVSEDADASYAQSFSGDCDSSGDVVLAAGEDKTCTITNNDISEPVIVPPLIEIVKVPSPLTLPSGPGIVTYTFTLRNIGTVTATNITVDDDSCSPLAMISGDTNTNSQLEVNETWTYACSMMLTQTHTNNVIATGLANGITAVDTASATVVVGSELIPPLVHVTKVPNVFTLPTGGGEITYAIRVTNPGAVALQDITISDDTCTPVEFVSGDTNSNNALDINEAWVYVCIDDLRETTTNTVFVSGEANGMTARDIAIATVVVADAPPKLPYSTPGLPNTGYSMRAPATR